MMAAPLTINNEIIKSASDSRLYRGVILQNNLTALLISDPSTDKSAAALNVNVGHMSDPWELPGLAHFLEHMLFLGTEKFPDEAEYERFLTKHGGAANASTGPANTSFYFNVAPDHMFGALDRFGQFFIAPLFTESATEREVNAVNKENDKNIANDGRIMVRMEKTLVDEKHEYSKFGTGNKESLEENPAKNGINVRDELIKFHEKWYSSNIMTLAVLGREDLDTLQNMVLDIFGKIEDKDIRAPEWHNSPFTDEQLRKITYVVPVKDIRRLNLTWSIPDMKPYYKTDPTGYLEHLIEDKGPGSLYSHLKTQGLINSVSSSWCRPGKGFAFFKISFSLTEEGVDELFEIISVVFQFLELIKRNELEEWIFDECKDLKQMRFRYKDKESPTNLVCNKSRKLIEYPMTEVLNAGYDLTEWKPGLIRMVLDLLTPQNLQVIAVSQKFGDKCTDTEKWYGFKYKTEKIDAEKLNAWTEMDEDEDSETEEDEDEDSETEEDEDEQDEVKLGLNKKLSLPDKNEFIATNFELIQTEERFSIHPVIIEETDFGRLWYMQDAEFLLPKSCITIEIRSAASYKDPHMANLLHIFVSLLKDSLKDVSHAAAIAGLHYGINSCKYGIDIRLEGFNHKQSCLLDKVLAKIKNVKVDEKNNYVRALKNYVRALKNFEVEQPSIQAKYFLSLLLNEKKFSKSEKLEVIHLLTADSVQSFIPEFFSSLFITCFIYGNTTEIKARELHKNVMGTLKTPSTLTLPEDLRKPFREIKLDPGQYLHRRDNNTHKSSCLVNHYQCGVKDTRNNVLLQLLVQVMKQPCFYQLRTVEQLGYIVVCEEDSNQGAGVQGILFGVQSDRHPDYLDHRVEVFVEGVEEMIEGMEEEEFKKHVEALAARRLDKPKKLISKNYKMWAEINTGLHNFDRDNVEVEELRRVGKEDLLRFYRNNVARSGERKKISCQVLSTLEGGPVQDSDQVQVDSEPMKCLDEVKPSLGFYPLPETFLPLKELSSN